MKRRVLTAIYWMTCLAVCLAGTLTICLGFFVVIVATGGPISGVLGNPLTLACFTIAMVVALIVTMAVHEFGHWSTAHHYGVCVTAVHLGPVGWRQSDGWHAGHVSGDWFTWRVEFVRPADRRAFVAATLGGPVANLITGLLIAGVLPFSGPFIQCLAGCFVVWSATLGTANLFPIVWRGMPSDGLQLWWEWQRLRASKGV